MRAASGVMMPINRIGKHVSKQTINEEALLVLGMLLNAKTPSMRESRDGERRLDLIEFLSVCRSSISAASNLLRCWYEHHFISIMCGQTTEFLWACR